MTRAPRRIRRLHPDYQSPALSELLVTPYTTFHSRRRSQRPSGSPTS